MIGFILIILAVMGFVGLGWMLTQGNFLLFMNTAIIESLVGFAFIALFGALWEFYFQQPAKNMIANRRAASWRWLIDDLGYVTLEPSKKYLAQGLVEYKWGWTLLPRPIMKLDVLSKLPGRRPGRPSNNPEKERQLQAQYDARQGQKNDMERYEMELAEKLALKQFSWRGMGKPISFVYAGLAANFNPAILVPSEIKQDNPHDYVEGLRKYVRDLAVLPTNVKNDLLAKFTELETHLDHIRIAVNPRTFKELHPHMYTQSQVDDHGRVHFRLGQLSVTGIPMKWIVIILLVVGVIGGLAAVYIFFIQPNQPKPQPQQAASLIRLLVQLLLNRLK